MEDEDSPDISELHFNALANDYLESFGSDVKAGKALNMSKQYINQIRFSVRPVSEKIVEAMGYECEIIKPLPIRIYRKRKNAKT